MLARKALQSVVKMTIALMTKNILVSQSIF